MSPPVRTPEERRRPELINGSRRLRIANGSGTTTAEVNRLVKQLQDMQKMMKRMGGLGTKGKKKTTKSKSNKSIAIPAARTARICSACIASRSAIREPKEKPAQ